MRRLFLFHPLLFALCPILWLYAHNIGELNLHALWMPLGCALLFSGLLWLLIYPLVRRDVRKTSALTTLLLILVFSYSHVYNVTAVFESTVSYWRFLYFGLWLLTTTVSCWALARLRVNSARLTEALAMTALILLSFSLFTIGRYEWIRTGTVRHLETHEHEHRRAGIPADALPNIYLIVLDSYPGPETMRRIFDLDNRPFLDALRQRGFYVAEQSRSNYCQTILSISSLLNFSYHDSLMQLPGITSGDRRPLEAMLDNNRVCRTLKEYGYRTVIFPSSYEPISMPSDIDVGHIKGFADFNVAVINSTPLLMLSLTAADTKFDAYAVHRERILSKYRHLPDTLQLEGPLFVYAHIMAPHQPLVFDENGRSLKADPYVASRSGRHWRQAPNDRADYNRKFRGEVLYLNKLTLTLIDTIQHGSKRPSVILLQADHGPGFLPDTEQELHTISIPERFQILNAYYFPDGKTERLYPSITPVNSFRVIFNTYLQTDLPLLSDRSYFSPFLHLYNFLDITDATHFGQGAEMRANRRTRQRIADYMRQ